MKVNQSHVWLVVVLVSCLVYAACSKPTPAEKAKKILGECKSETSSGVYDLSLNNDNTWLTVTYHYYLTGTVNVKEAVGSHLTPKVRKLYEELPELDTAQFVVQRPYFDKAGNISWLKDAHFTFTRTIYESIKWDSFSGANLLDVAERPWTSD